MKFSIVTPTYNSEHYLSETIDSVLSQEGNFEIEYILADGGSKDSTVSLFTSYKEKIDAGVYPIRCKKITMHYLSEKDHGMYDALNKGFAHASGEISAWINSDDYYLPGAFESVTTIFEEFSDIEWITGVTEVIGTDRRITSPPRPLYIRSWLSRGIYGTVAPFVLQDSTFWRTSLFVKAGPLDERCRYAGDYGLWIAFAKYATLWTFPKAVSRFRIRPGQLSASSSKYQAEQALLCPRKGLLPEVVKVFYWSRSRIPTFVKPFWDFSYRFLFPYSMRDYIDFDKNGRVFKAETKSIYLPYESPETIQKK